MILTDLHVHTTYCDGKNTPEEMVLAAISKNMECIGFSVHSYTFFDESYCIKKENISAYKEEISFLKEKYKGKIKILCGVEQDFYSKEDTSGFDYVIGSVHYIECDGKYIPIDESAEIFENAAKMYFDGDFYSMASKYYQTVSNLKGIDIIGHFDIITKFNENNRFFDTEDTRYKTAYKSALDKLLKLNIPFEINTGAISRGYRTFAYPEKEIQDYIKTSGGRLILSSDAHSTDALLFDFDKYEI